MHNQTEDELTKLSGVEWRLVTFNETPAVSGQYLVFDTDGKYHAKFCNGLGGSYTLVNHTFVSTNTISTLMACTDSRMSVEQTFARALSHGLSVTVAGTELTLATDDGSLFIFSAPGSAQPTTSTSPAP